MATRTARLVAIAVAVAVVLTVIVISTPVGNVPTALLWTAIVCGTAYYIVLPRVLSHWRDWKSRP